MTKVWVGVCFVALIVALLAISIRLDGVITDQQALTKHVIQLELEVKQYEQDVLNHEDIMRTYQFFNERWTKEMKGE